MYIHAHLGEKIIVCLFNWKTILEVQKPTTSMDCHKTVKKKHVY